MKTTMRDLDTAVLKKLNQFDNIVNNFNPSDPDGFIAYGANGFYIKKTNDTYLRKVFSEDEIENLERTIYKNDNSHLEVSSLTTDMRCDGKVNAAFRTGLIDVTPDFSIHTCDSEFHLSDRRHEKVILLTNDGQLIYITDDEVDWEKDIISAINEEFLIPGFNAHSVMDIKLKEDGDILIATSAGVFLYQKKTGKPELFCPFQANFIVPLNNEKVLMFGDNETVLTNDKGRIIEHYRQIQKAFHDVSKVVFDGDYVFALGRPTGKAGTDKLVHGWKMDAAGELLENIDKVISKHRDNSKFDTKWIDITKKSLFLISSFEDRLVLWRYNLDALYKKPEEITLNIMNFSEANNVHVVSDKSFLITIGEKVYLITDENEIKGSFTIDLDLDSVHSYKNKIYFLSEGAYSYFDVPTFEARKDILTFKVYDDKESCNNIDILVKGVTRANTITFAGREAIEIKPSYYAIYNEESAIIKLINCRSNYIEMSIAVDANTHIEGIAVKRNKIFLR